MRTISHFINGQSVTRTGAVTSPVYDPITGQVQANMEHGDAALLAEAVAAAQAAQPAWAANNSQQRARVIFKFKALIEEHKQELVHLDSIRFFTRTKNVTQRWPQPRPATGL
jgi:malonate-semialdehyde dehydrogenase (acetylating)/methylmalonate-semialdehyde dehydrogenase